MHFLFIRHAQSFVNLDDWQGGFIDAGLTPLGQQQAQSLGQWLAQNVPIDVLYSSSMARALETAAYVTQATGIAAQPDDRLREFGNCYADGRTVPPETMPIHYPDFWGTMRPYTPISADGENWMLFRARVGSFVDTLLEQHASAGLDYAIAVVCHAAVMDAAFDYILNVGAYRRAELITHNTGIMHWEYNPQSSHEFWRLHAYNMVLHLNSGNGVGSQALPHDASHKVIGENEKRSE